MGTPRAENEDHAKLRFQIELEFVQCLANPNYLNFLAQRGHLKEQTFINYLKYLEYWKQPEYAKFLKYPMSLYFLDLLQHPEFRKELANNKCSKFVEDQQLLHWQHYIRKRSKLAPPVQPPEIPGPGQATSSSTSATVTATATSTAPGSSTSSSQQQPQPPSSISQTQNPPTLNNTNSSLNSKQN